ncbi:uncharacterized protein TNCV_4066381 [Trichonephila clavipes]|uniref:Uncharacterized protein n=1 Tax=Trichonephila clavipes TaxID=2585209 RepID=A0A8X6W8S9_TRICX|nr:uncharacterized protein TNCV_4066381 [Trichonephila clavipes]
MPNQVIFQLTYLNAMFSIRWIGCSGPVLQISRSPDLWSFDYFLWGFLKNVVSATPFDLDEDSVARISETDARVRETPGIFERVRQSLHRRYQACIVTGGRNFKQNSLSKRLSINTLSFLSYFCASAPPRHLSPYIPLR